jgi:hypothetical protein
MINSVDKLRSLETPATHRLNGYLAAAQQVFVKGEYEVALEAAFFEILDPQIDDEEVVVAAYSELNPIEHRQMCSLDEMIAGVHQTLSIPRWMWQEAGVFPNIIEENLREGYWAHVKACFDYTDARIVSLGHHVPYVNIGGAGFTYILYAPDMSKCALLVGNVCD